MGSGPCQRPSRPAPQSSPYRAVAEAAWLQLISSTRWDIVSLSWSEQIALEALWRILHHVALDCPGKLRARTHDVWRAQHED